MVLGWLQLVVVIGTAGALIGAGLAALMSDRWIDKLESVAPGPRFTALVGISTLPVLFALLAISIGFAPSLLDAAGIVADHCAHHGGHAFHLCFVHGHPPEPSPLILGSAFVLLLWLGSRWGEEFARLRDVRSWNDRLRHLARYDEEIDGWTLDSHRPLAFAVGLLRPKVCISEGLRNGLSASQLDVVLAHERAHVSRYDSLVKFVARLSARLHLPHIRERLNTELDLACEQACDEIAAESVGDRLTVAESLLAVERASDENPAPALALGFRAGELERRVKSMLENPWRRPSRRRLAFATAIAVGTLVTSYDVFHHAVESLLSLAL